MLITNREGVSNANIPLHFPEYTEVIYGTNERSASFYAHKRQAETSQELRNHSDQLHFIQSIGVQNLQLVIADFG